MGLPDLPVESAVNLSDGLAYLIVEDIVYQMDTSSLQVSKLRDIFSLRL